MKKPMVSIAAGILLMGLTLSSCTVQERAKNYGGTTTENLPSGKKLVNVTWKDDHLWILQRDAQPGEKPTTYEFKESSSYGIWQGTVRIVEH